MGEIELSIVVPCLNEAEALEVVVRKAMTTMAELGVDGEVIVADNGSTDGSQAIAAEAGARVVEVAEKGYGSALAGGIAAAHGTYVIMGDADDTYDFTGIGPFVEKLREGYDLVMGNRFKGGIEPGAMPWLHRYVGNPVLSGLGKLFFHSSIGDFHCGLRGFRKEAVERLDLRTTGMEFASEMIVKATLLRVKVTEVPTTLSTGLRSRAPHLRTWRDGWRHLRFLLLYSPRWLFLYPGLLLMVLGLAGQLWLLPGPRIVGNVGFDIQSLLFTAVAIVVGFQSVVFAVFTKIYATNEGLLPPSAKLDRLFRYVTLEVGLVVGLVLLLAGLGGSIAAFLKWGDVSFRALDPFVTLRIIIPSVTALILGFETILASFFLSVLGLRHR
jgi:glycosyltransferase involved in cell wall biosynthesis